LTLAEIQETRTRELRSQSTRSPAFNSQTNRYLSSTRVIKATKSRARRLFAQTTISNKIQSQSSHVPSNHAQTQGQTPSKPVERTK